VIRSETKVSPMMMPKYLAQTPNNIFKAVKLR
jgi:hypothetical protein